MCKRFKINKELRQKGVFSYEYIDNLEKLNEPEFATIDKFYSSLNDSNVKQEECDHAMNIWITRCKNRKLKTYQILYNFTDVLELCDLFENFCDTCHKTYSLSPLWYYSLQDLSWDSMLKYTNIELEFFTKDQNDMMDFIEYGIRFKFYFSSL